MEDILASIKRVIAEEKELRATIPPPVPVSVDDDDDEDVLELDHPVEDQLAVAQPFIDTGPSLLDPTAADTSRAKLAQLTSVAAAAPPPPPPQPSGVNPLEEMLRDMLRPVLKQWLDENLPKIVDEHVRREISRITGKPL